ELVHGFGAARLNRPREALAAYADIDERGPMGEWPLYWRSVTGTHHTVGDHRRELAVARRGRERFPGATTLVCEVRALAAMGNVRAVRRRLDESLDLAAHPRFGTPADVMETAALELRAHGHAAAARDAAHRAIAWYVARSPAEQGTEAERYGLG